MSSALADEAMMTLASILLLALVLYTGSQAARETTTEVAARHRQGRRLLPAAVRHHHFRSERGWRHWRWTRWLLVAALPVMGWPSPAAAQTPTPPAASQNPSPMVEETRAHERLAPRELAGTRRSFMGPAGRSVELLVPHLARTRDDLDLDLVVHFHGAAWLPQQAVAGLGRPAMTAVVNLGAGSGAYDRAFADPAAFDSLLAGVTREGSAAIGKPVRVGRVTLVGFSAGHGAVRAILREPRHAATVDAVLLLDGMHTSYVPDGTVLAAGGALDTTNLVAFATFARKAMRGEKRFLVTHSEIFPGTFASTTETADWLLRALGLRRTPVLRWGPRGMQQLSEVRAGRFALLGFAGNTAPDHIDHLHAMRELLARLSDSLAVLPGSGSRATSSSDGMMGSYGVAAPCSPARRSSVCSPRRLRDNDGDSPAASLRQAATP